MRLRRGFGLASGFLSVLVAASGVAQAQYFGGGSYPGGYGGYGWGGWGRGGGSIANDPAGGYMAGLGSYARGIGTYEVQNAQATAINAETMLKWNDALRARQRVLRQEQQAEQARKQAELVARAGEVNVETGATLNDLLDRIQEFNPGAARSDAAGAEISPSAIRDIPFEPATEAISLCLDQMTVDDAWPEPLDDDRFTAQRQAVRAAVRRALDEDLKGEVSADALKQIDAAVAALRARYQEATGNLGAIDSDADAFTLNLASLSRLLRNPAYQHVLAELETYKGTTVGDLLGFMQAFNLRFGPAASPRQREIYQTLAPMFEQVLAASGPEARTAALDTDPTGHPLREAARDAFKGIDWKTLDQHAKAEK